jgi:hypothetical protein
VSQNVCTRHTQCCNARVLLEAAVYCAGLLMNIINLQSIGRQESIARGSGRIHIARISVPFMRAPASHSPIQTASLSLQQVPAGVFNMFYTGVHAIPNSTPIFVYTLCPVRLRLAPGMRMRVHSATGTHRASFVA